MTKTITLEGRNTVHDALISDKKVTKLLVAEESLRDEKIQDIINLAKKNKVDVQVASSKQIKNKSESANPQNIIAEMELEDVSLEEILDRKKDPLLLIYNRLDYEQNLGAIMRTAWGAGVDAVLVSPNGVHQLTPVVAKVSMGGAANVPLIGESLFPLLKMLKDRGIPIVGVEEGEGEAYTEQNLIGSVAFVFGGEDAGLSDPIKKYCDLFIHIPMHSQLSSLNVSVATAIVLFEKLRQDRENNL
jgi:23S rRNA (guanosine2251-2'-O)-methyltransferase